MNWKLEIKNWKLARRGFTIVELLVAMSLLVILLGLSGMVFQTTVAAHRAAGATIDVTRNLSAMTEQLNADFGGLRKDAPMFIAFNAFDTDGDLVPDTYFDTIHFFAIVNYQTTKQYDYDSTGNGISDGIKVIRADNAMARVFYGHANSVDAVTSGVPDYADFGLLTRKVHVLTADDEIASFYGEIPAITNTSTGVIDYTPFHTSFGILPAPDHTSFENQFEFDTISLADWVNALNLLELPGPIQINANHFIASCMTDASRPVVDLTDINTLHLLLSQGVLQMRIQWAYTADDLQTPGLFAGIRWWPSIDPAGNRSVVSDFVTMSRSQLGVYFQLPNGANIVDIDGDGSNDWLAIQNCGTGGFPFKSTFYPKAMKFTFVLKDSNGIFTDGKTFTYIVYIDN